MTAKLPPGSEYRKGGKYPRILVKTNEGKWKAKNFYIWEEYHKRPVPKGHRIIFLDGNKNNFAIENLHCIPMGEATRRCLAKPVGSEINTPCGKSLYVRIKTSDGKWKLKHVYIWEQFNQKKLPKGHCIIFLDGDKNNFAIENLECVCWKELALIKKGNTKPIGSERKAPGGATFIKIDETKWKLKHVYIWEQFYQKVVPENHIVIFLDRNKKNFSIENLECVSKEEFKRLVEKDGFLENAELTRLGILVTKLGIRLKDLDSEKYTQSLTSKNLKKKLSSKK